MMEEERGEREGAGGCGKGGGSASWPRGQGERFRGGDRRTARGRCRPERAQPGVRTSGAHRKSPLWQWVT